MEEDTAVSLDYDKEKLYYNMVGCKADWLYELPAVERQSSLRGRIKGTLQGAESFPVQFVKAKKIGRNDPCPCGSGKKYKKCCGKNA